MIRRAFTLIELLVTIAIMGLLIGILVPTLAGARKTARSAVCLNSQRQTAIGMHAYAGDHKEIVIPSYNMSDTVGASPCDGWAPILDRDGYLPASVQTKASAFYCPDTIDVEGLASGQTGTDRQLPKGWMDWPNRRTGSRNLPELIPARGFNKIIRVSYSINADNPIGNAINFTPDLYFTSSVGYGPSPAGKFMALTRVSAFRSPSSLIATADGVYAGRHRDNKVGAVNSRIGYRHHGSGGGAANVAFADGHASIVSAREFPHGIPSNPADLPAVREENAYGRPTVFADPERALATP